MTTKIRIGDIACIARYDLTGDVLTMTDSGGCADALADNGCEVSEDMDDADIGAEVLRAWGEDYEGDMHASGVSIYLTRDGEAEECVAGA